MSLSVESSMGRRLESSSFTDGSQRAEFLQPAAGRILTGAGLAGDQLQQVMRHHSSIARRIVIGRQILKIVAKGSQPG